MDCVEHYSSHRVSTKFGFDQYVLDCVKNASGHTPKSAWANYNRPIEDVKICIPSRFVEPNVNR